MRPLRWQASWTTWKTLPVNDGRSPIWGGATLGFVVGLILGFFVGSYWMTVLYSVLIGAGVGFLTILLSWVGKAGHR